MDAARLGRRFLESTRGQIVALLRRGPLTVEDLARSLGLTDNAVRNHLSALERDGLVRQEGVRRGGGVGKPATLYELHADADVLFSRAYQPVLRGLLDVLSDELPRERAEELMRDVGRRLGRGAGGRASGDLDSRIRVAGEVIAALGGDVRLVDEGGRRLLRGSGCPLSAVVTHRPEACRAVEGLVSEILGVPVATCCERAGRPRCCFEIDAADPAAA